MMDRWETRWKNNVARYTTLACVKMILPWSTPSMRFCTSELKVAVITSALRKRYPTHDILNVAGIRRQESATRRKMPVSAANPKLARKGYRAFTWNAIIEWSIEQVFSCIDRSGVPLHEAYTKYNASRVSCAFCIMSAQADLRAAAACEDNSDLYVRMVELEVTSTFAFQGGKWLADIAPHLLPGDLRARVPAAKQAAALREAAESILPKHLLYTKGWPDCIPTLEEAEVIAEMRIRVASALGLAVGHTTAFQVIERYVELLAQKNGDVEKSTRIAA
jgi:3'-phosphoadenosine 5'-phosphosulfate sulfotransferase (PAPS reductase)/FAD synthetase